jgi:hypothetical protein
VLVHTAFKLQPPLLDRHSLISETLNHRKNNVEFAPTRVTILAARDDAFKKSCLERSGIASTITLLHVSIWFQAYRKCQHYHQIPQNYQPATIHSKYLIWYNRKQSPAQVNPFPAYPATHAQVKLPGLLVHTACKLQPPLLVRHSLISGTLNH